MAITLAKALSSAGHEAFLMVANKLRQGIEWEKMVVVNSEEDYYSVLKRVRIDFDYIALIAPPQELIKASEIVGDKLLGPSLQLIKIFSDKYHTMIALSNCGIRVPKTVLVNDSSKYIAELHNLRPPYVVKPTLLAGAECTYLVNDESKLREYVEKVCSCDPSRKAIIQEYVKGVHGSLSVVCGQGKPLLYSINLQLIVLSEDRLSYAGGVLPIRHRYVREKAEEIVTRLCSCYPDLKGYTGLDVVWNDRDLYVVEVNPRATTSIVGLYEAFPRLGEILVSSVIGGFNEFMFVGDILSHGYIYYVLLDKEVSKHSNEKVISVKGFNKVILVGRGSREYVLQRLQELLHGKRVVYDLKKAL